jgi:predicted NUDIX family phosphoesterase
MEGYAMQESGKHLEEHVLVFPAQVLEQIGIFQGLSFEVDKYLEIILDPKNQMFLQRKEAESNPAYKQLIPYAILHCKEKVFVYRRGKLQGEKRLLGNFSLGIGGHISISDPTLFGTTYQAGLQRELDEEVSLESGYTQRIVALLNDDSNEVGKVHFGIVHTIELERTSVKPKEKSINETRFFTTDELQKDVDKFENWSQICIRNIHHILTHKL